MCNLHELVQLKQQIKMDHVVIFPFYCDSKRNNCYCLTQCKVIKRILFISKTKDIKRISIFDSFDLYLIIWLLWDLEIKYAHSKKIKHFLMEFSFTHQHDNIGMSAVNVFEFEKSVCEKYISFHIKLFRLRRTVGLYVHKPKGVLLTCQNRNFK